MFPDIDGAWLALIGTLFGGAGLKVIEAYLGRTKQKQDHGAVIREELRKEVIGLRDELAKAKIEEQRLESEVEAWRAKFYDQFVTITEKSTELTLANAKIQELSTALDDFKKRVSALEGRMGAGTE